jgi:signal transduction histidine kinase
MTKKSINFTGIINRVFIIFLLFTFLVATGSFILRYSINAKLDRLSRQLNLPTAQPGLSALVVDLDVAENAFQRASTDGNKKDLLSYQHQLDTIFHGITSVIEHYRNAADNSLPESRQELAKGLQKKLELSRQLFELRKNFDSLLRVTTFDGIHNRGKLVSTQPLLKDRRDTLVSTKKELSKNSLLHRLKEAFQATQSVKIMTIQQQRKNAALVANADARGLLAQISSEYGRLAVSGQALVQANLNLLTRLRQLINQLQDIDRVSYERSREAALRDYAATTRDLNTFSGVSLVAIIIFIPLLIIYIRRAGWAERRLRVASNRAIKLAGQKSELLAIMSHEIRNKLMAINGAVFTLKRTSISPEQEQKLSAINLASGLVLETINNVLDVSKLEQGYAEAKKIEPFHPGQALRDAVEAMRFTAENKGLEIRLNLAGVMEATVSGDSFRLKQILLNLLSNAIKYTEFGSVIVNGQLESLEEGYQLKVEVQDTGPGISVNSQNKLFTPYYQADGHQPGTGLGLYLCRKLINDQGGNISLESDSGKGCIIRFNIIYQSAI